MTAIVLQPASHIFLLEWLWVAGSLVVAGAVSLGLVVMGEPGGWPWPLSWMARASSSLERVTGMPGWCAGAVLLLVWGIAVAGVGFYWDVGWHIDFGRDDQLFTPPHTMMVFGLVFMALGGVVSIVMATMDQAPGVWRLKWLRIPRGGLALLVLGLGAIVGFPLDDLWHRTYGIDVTLWSPSHLMMLTGAILSTVAAWLLIGEAGVARTRHPIGARLARLAPALVLLALAAYQLEYDDGVPQWQALYQPLLIVVSATLPLVATRVALGRWAALLAAVSFVGIRAALGVLTGPVLGHTLPHFPLYIGIGLAVETGFALTRGRPTLLRALAAGALAGTIGLATEWGFSLVWARQPWQPAMLQGIWAAVLIAVPAAILGAALGGAIGRRGRLIRGPVLALAGIAVLALLTVPLPRNPVQLSAVITTTPTAEPVPTADRYGEFSLFQPVKVDVQVTPADAVRNADWFEVIAWQGGGQNAVPLHEVAPGHWRTDVASPTGGTWKTFVYLARGDVIAGAPIAMPADPTSNRAAISLLPQRTETFDNASRFLLRETHPGAAWVAAMAYWLIGLIALVWVALIAVATLSLAGEDPVPPGGAAPAARGGGRALSLHQLLQR